MSLLALDPVPTLIGRTRNELSAAFEAGRPMRLSRAPGRLDVMGGIADYTGSLVCEMPLGVAAAVALQEREDRQIGVFSFNLLDAHLPFRFQMSLDALAKTSAESLRREFGERGRTWAGYVVGCLFLLHEQGYVNLADPGIRGVNLAIYSTVPSGGGVSSSAALEVATMTNLVGHFAAMDLKSQISDLKSDGLKLAELCQQVENRIVGAPCGIMDQVASTLGEAGTLMRLLCQPHEVQPPLALPVGIKAIGINTNIKHSVGGHGYGRTRTAAFMAHRLILEQMRHLGAEAGKTMTSDPTGGYLANLASDDYKALFRPNLPEAMTGRAFFEAVGSEDPHAHGDKATAVEAATVYPIQRAADHHVLEAQRVRRFCDFLENINKYGTDKSLRSAGHLMYASHRSYGENAGLGAPEADLLVDLVKQHESAGLYGAKITGGGSGGTVAVLLEDVPQARQAVEAILETYRERTGLTPDLLDSTSPGAFHVGSEVMTEG